MSATIEKLNVEPDFTVTYRITRADGSFHRHSLMPGSDLSNHPAEVVALCESAWTDDVLAQFNHHQMKTPVPQTVTMAQARIALQSAGKLASIQAGLEALPEPQRSVALTAWEYAPTVSRSGSLVNTLSGQFGMSEEELDALFVAAGAIEL